MITIIDAKAILAVGTSMSASAIAAAWGILAITGPVAFAIALVRHSVGGRHPLFIVCQIVLVSFALRFYGNITGIIDSVGKTAAAQVNKAGNFQKLFESYQKDLDSTLKTNPDQAAPERSMLDVVTAFGAGLISGILSVIGALAVIVALHIYQILQAVLYGVLVAVGPIVIAVAIVPGAQGLVAKWLSALFELAMWPVIGAVIFEMVGAGLLSLHDAKDKNFVTMFSANIVLVLCVFLVPRIAARLVGSGFGAVGDVMAGKALGAAMAPFGSAGKAIDNKATEVATAGAKDAIGAIKGAIGSLSESRVYQPPPNGGPSGGLSSGPSLAEREGMSSDFGGVQSSGPTSFDASDADTRPNPPALDSAQGNGGRAAGGGAPPPLPIGDAQRNAPPERKGAQAPREVSLHVAKMHNEHFRRAHPGGEMKDGIYYTPDKVTAMKQRGEW